MRRVLLWLWAAFLISVTLVWNVRAYSPVDRTETSLEQLRFLSQKLEAGSALDAQRVFPEGFFFSWVLYGLASAQLATQLPDGHAEIPTLRNNALMALRQLDSTNGRAGFPQDLEPPLGAFYNAWVLYLQGMTIKAQGLDQTSPVMLEAFRSGCDRFAGALERNPTPFLASYAGQSWAVDTSIGIAALGLHDKLFAPRYQSAIKSWITRAKKLLDPQLGTLPHQSEFLTGSQIEGSRGGSLAMMILALAQADPEFAQSQYAAFRKHFLAVSYSIPGVLEYPQGQVDSGRADVDSGPIVLGFSGPAVIVGMGAAITMNDMQTARALNGFVETGGFAFAAFGQRRYLFGALPIGDAFLVWARTMQPLVTTTYEPVLPSFWAWALHLVSLLFVARVVFGVRSATRAK
jgi:hypothetical protein